MEGKTPFTLWIALGGLALSLLAANPTALAQASREPIKIGLLNALTGPLAVNGSEINEGIKLYFEDEMGGRARWPWPCGITSTSDGFPRSSPRPRRTT
jgi:hypothetical protein